MEIQKYKINRDLTGTTWTIPCSGTTNVWPMNTSSNCLDIPVKNGSCKDIYNYINGNVNDFPEDLKDCSPTTPCIILWDCGLPTTFTIPLPTTVKCSNLEGYNYVKFSGLRVTYSVPIQDNFYEVKKVITIAKNNNINLIPTVTKLDCDCDNPLNEVSHKVQIYLSQDFNDIGHYDLWDGNMSQRDLFANFTISADSSGYDITLTNTMNYSYYDELEPFTYTIDWGNSLSDTLNSNIPSITHTYSGPPGMQRTIKLIQDTPWGPMTSSKLLTFPLNNYAGMFGQAYVPGDVNNPGTGIGPGGINISGMAGNVPAGSSAYHGRYPDFPLDSATDIDQFSGMSFTGSDCYVVTGVTESILGNFQSYTNNNSLNLSPGYLLNVWVPIGGDVISPLNNSFQTGMYGVITHADAIYTAYTVSSSFGATSNSADGDTPITFYDMSNGITIFEADSCGLDKRAFGALACIDCPEDDCEWCMLKDEYYDRVDEINIQLPTIVQRNTWIPHPIADYIIGDMVYDETWNSCCCFIAVKNITPSDAWYGKPPSISNEGKFFDSVGDEVHVWEACSYDCISCGLGTQTPCNDTTSPGWTGEVYGVNTTTFTIGSYAEDEHGNCYEALNSGSLTHPTGSTYDWDYVGCVSWICPSDPAGTDCIMINGPQSGGTYGEMTYGGCLANLNSPNGCFPPQYACENQYGCEGCAQIDATSSLYNTSSSFSLASDCIAYCDPIAWSCTTPTSSNCCFELDCGNTYSEYISTVGTLYPGPATNSQLNNILSTYNVYVGPLYDASDCQDACCINTSWAWSCGEEACELIGGQPNGTTNFSTSAQCESYTLTLSQYSGQNATNLEDIVCGWTCLTQNIDCVYQPCEPCYYASCGWPTEGTCNTICSANTSCSCWKCYCDGNYSVDGGDCIQYNPCVAPPGESWVSWVDGYIGVQPGPNPVYNTYTDETICLESCECDVGWDCFLNSTGGTIGSCVSPGSITVMTTLGYTFSDSTPGFTGYTTFEECCDNTGCCFGDCIEFETDGVTPYELDVYQQSYYNALGGVLGTITPNSPFGPTTTFPCIWSPYDFPYPNAPQPAIPSGACNDPSAVGFTYISYLPWCNVDDCVTYNLTIDDYGNQVCADPPGECDCACSSHPDFSASTGGWNGSNSFYDAYDLGSAASWSDADTPNCCFICLCPNLGTDWTIMANITAAIGNQYMLDCNIMEPDLDPVSQGLGSGIVNCWESCNLAPQIPPDPANPNNCDPCGASDVYYECTSSGCVVSNCNDPSHPLCYTSSTCDDLSVGYSSCDASCFCNGWNSSSCVQSCIMEETVNLNPILFNMMNTCGPFNYINGTMDDCTNDLTNGVIDCCSDIEQWYCDGSTSCSALNLAQVSSNIGNGVGCVQVYANNPQYETSLTNNFATQLECQENCRWKCDPNGFATCEFITTYPVSLIGTYPSAFSCYLSTDDCDCTNAPSGWWCYDDQDPTSTNGGCISNVGGLNPTQQNFLYGQNQGLYNGGGLAFLSSADCEADCRFCCDESGTNGGYCEFMWQGIGCCNVCSDYPSELDCSTAQGFKPCVPIFGLEYFCDLTLGCTQFPSSIAPGSGPSATGDGWPTLNDCELECAFDCSKDCECTITLTPDYTVANPMNGLGAPWAQITSCIIQTSNGDKCCDCDCFANNAAVYVTHYDPNTLSWAVATITANNLTNPVPPWVSGSYLPTANNGDVVTHNGCCFVVLNSHTSAAQHLVSPSQDYSNYINNLASSNPADWPSYISNWGNPVIYFPCDPNCVSVTGSTGSSKSWYCDTNIITNTSNCVQEGSWGSSVSQTYLDGVFGIGQVSYTNDPNNGFASDYLCREKCRFCCDNVAPPQSCEQCCRGTLGYYMVNVWPCKCIKGDTAVPLYKCKIIPPKGPGGPSEPEPEPIQMISDTYLETYNNRTGNPNNQYNLLLQKFNDTKRYCGSKSKTSDGDNCSNILSDMKRKLDELKRNGGSSGPSVPGKPCVQTQSCSAGNQWVGHPTCKCMPFSSSVSACVLDWGNINCLTTIYSCETLTAPCGVDPCDECNVSNMYYTIDDHLGVYLPNGTQGWSINVPSYNGIWYPGLVTDAYSDLYVTDPIDSCCYYNATDYISHSLNPTGAWTFPPSVCYENHIQGLYCDGSSYYPGNPYNATQQQHIFPLWWPCDTACPTAQSCYDCDSNTPLWDASVTYSPGDNVLWFCTDPVVLSAPGLYCCFKADVGFSQPSGWEPTTDQCAYWIMMCGCDDDCALCGTTVCGVTCPCDENTPLWDYTTQINNSYQIGDQVLWACTIPVITLPNTLEYCCYELTQLTTIQYGPGSVDELGEYWTVKCGENHLPHKCVTDTSNGTVDNCDGKIYIPWDYSSLQILETTGIRPQIAVDNLATGYTGSPNAEVAVEVIVANFGIDAVLSDYIIEEDDNQQACVGPGGYTKKVVKYVSHDSLSDSNPYQGSSTWRHFIDEAISRGADATLLTGIPAGASSVGGYLMSMQGNVRDIITDAMDPLGAPPSCPNFSYTNCDRTMWVNCCAYPCSCEPHQYGGFSSQYDCESSNINSCCFDINILSP